MSPADRIAERTRQDIAKARAIGFLEHALGTAWLPGYARQQAQGILDLYNNKASRPEVGGNEPTRTTADVGSSGMEVRGPEQREMEKGETLALPPARSGADVGGEGL